MKKFLTIAMTGIFVFTLQGPLRAQKEVAPPPIPPLLEGQRPLEHLDTTKPAAPRQVKQRKTKAKSRVKSKKAKVKSPKTKRRAKIKKSAGKKRRAAVKKRSPKATKKKRSAETRRQAGPDEG